MSNDAQGSPILALLSLRNFGSVSTTGAEFTLDYVPRTSLMFRANYTYIDFKVHEEIVENPLLPNSPPHRVGASMTYFTPRFNATAGYRWVDGFVWSVGLFSGPIPSYNVVDLAASYRLSNVLTLGVDVSNALNNEHYEVFGGDVLRRRALAHLTVRWS
jgi:outer membrane receptor protein involved in Fe transport